MRNTALASECCNSQKDNPPLVYICVRICGHITERTWDDSGDRILWKIFGPKRDEVTAKRENFISSLSRCYSGGRSKENEMGTTCSLPEVQKKSNQGFGVER